MKALLHSFAVFNTLAYFVYSVPALIYFTFILLLGRWCKNPALMKYGLEVLVGIDETYSACLLGEASETVSSRCGRALLSGKPRPAVKCLAWAVDLFFLKVVGEKFHCIGAVEKFYKDGANLEDEQLSFIKH